MAATADLDRATKPTNYRVSDTAIMLSWAGLPIGLILLSGLRLPLAWVARAPYVATLVPVLGIASTKIATADFLGGAGERCFTCRG